MNKEDLKAKDLKDLRLIKGLSQGQMAKYLCCCHTGISIVERGESPITRNMIQNLPDVYALPDNPRVKRDAKCISIFDVKRTGLDRINAMKIKLNCRTNGEVLHKLLDMAEGVESEK
jgi:transcriptional regulator with XRE-family HTH domain